MPRINVNIVLVGGRPNHGREEAITALMGAGYKYVEPMLPLKATAETLWCRGDAGLRLNKDQELNVYPNEPVSSLADILADRLSLDAEEKCELLALHTAAAILDITVDDDIVTNLVVLADRESLLQFPICFDRTLSQAVAADVDLSIGYTFITVDDSLVNRKWYTRAWKGLFPEYDGAVDFGDCRTYIRRSQIKDLKEILEKCPWNEFYSDKPRPGGVA